LDYDESSFIYLEISVTIFGARKRNAFRMVSFGKQHAFHVRRSAYLKASPPLIVSCTIAIAIYIVHLPGFTRAGLPRPSPTPTSHPNQNPKIFFFLLKKTQKKYGALSLIRRFQNCLNFRNQTSRFF
jgi:hypothetical protein